MIMRIPILKSILRNLDWFEEAQKHHKAPEGTIFVGGINHRLKKEDWVEQKHPRADDGKFTSGSGGGSKKPSKTKRKLERRAEAASQGRVSGAIQTLLSGGSALDKIGWLNTSKPKEPEKKPDSKLKEEAAPAKVPTNEEMAASGVTERNYREYLKKPPESLSLAEYVAAKQLQYYNERGDTLPAETAAEWYHSAATKPPKVAPRVPLADQATKLKLKELKELPLGKLRSMQAALQKHPKINNPAYPEGKKYDKALRMVEGAIYSKV